MAVNIEDYVSTPGEDVDPAVLARLRDLEDVGHEFHGNQYTGGGSSYDFHDQRMNTVAKNYAESLGFDPNRVSVERYTKQFQVGDRTFNEGGHYDNTTGMITLNQNSLFSKHETEMIVAHEVTHHEFNEVMKNVPEMGGPDVVSTDLPKTTAFFETYNSRADELAASDGVSPYSSAYWVNVARVASNTTDSIDWEHEYDTAFRNATNETLAEISSLKHAYDQGGAHSLAPVWRDLHQQLRDAYTEVQAQRSNIFKRVKGLEGE